MFGVLAGGIGMAFLVFRLIVLTGSGADEPAGSLVSHGVGASALLAMAAAAATQDPPSGPASSRKRSRGTRSSSERRSPFPASQAWGRRRPGSPEGSKRRGCGGAASGA